MTRFNEPAADGFRQMNAKFRTGAIRRSRSSRLSQRLEARRLSFEQLEPRTLLAADFLLPSLIAPDELPHQKLSPDVPSLIADSDPGVSTSQMKLQVVESDGSPSGELLLSDSFLLQIQLSNPGPGPWNSGGPIRIIIGFDPLVIQPEDIGLPHELHCDFDAGGSSSELRRL
jgi:hypothetical protein